MKAEIHYLKNENSILHNENQQFKKKVEELEVRISELEKFQGKKHNERSAGRKSYDNKDTVRKIYRMFAQSKTYQYIADRLNKEGITTKSGGSWSKSSVRYILYNKSYVDKKILTEKEYNLDFSESD